MVTDRLLPPLLVLVLLLAGLAPARAVAQEEGGPSLLLINPDTRVASVDFAFPTGAAIEESRLRVGIGLHAPGGLAGVQRFFGWLPFVSPPPLMPFDPVQVQKDKIRLTRIYEREGFPSVAVAYRVRLDTTANTVAVTFVIDQGAPLLLDTVRIVGADRDTLVFPEELASSWQRLRRSLDGETGSRLNEQLQTRIRSDLLEWLRDHGYAFATVSHEVRHDSTTGATMVLTADPGARARIGSVVIHGNRRLSEGSIMQQLPFRPDDPFRSRDLAEGQRQVFGLDLVRLALVDIAPDQPRDSTADVLVQVNEGSLRVIDGRLGYTSQGGVAANTSWQHRNFVGGARTLDIDATARTGLLAAAEGKQIQLGAGVSVHQPYLGDRRVSGQLSPFIEYRNDQFDQSVRSGFDATVLWERGALRSMSVRYGFSVRNVSTARGGGLAGVSDLLGLLRSIDTANVDVRTSVLGYRVSWGRLDDLLHPTSGWLARLNTEVAGPSPISTVEYGRVDGSVRVFLPLVGGTLLSARLSAGRLFPFGRSVPPPGQEGLSSLLRLRDVVFTAGGTEDVRGWASGLLGTKVPDFNVDLVGDTLELRNAGRYVPLGGLGRWSGSVELQAPLPFVGRPHAIFGFLDAGQVWINDARFLPEGTLSGLEDDVYAGLGGGLEFGTPVGPVRIALGYKLNPSPLDLRDPREVGDALIMGLPLESVPTRSGRRWQIHLSLGRSL